MRPAGIFGGGFLSFQSRGVVFRGLEEDMSLPEPSTGSIQGGLRQTPQPLHGARLGHFFKEARRSLSSLPECLRSEQRGSTGGMCGEECW